MRQVGGARAALHLHRPERWRFTPATNIWLYLIRALTASYTRYGKRERGGALVSCCLPWITSYFFLTCRYSNLSKNRFSELPVEVTEYYSLEKLILYHNAIKSIPDSVVYLQSLLYLDLSRNQLSVLPSSLCQLPLEVLLVANNKLVSLPEELGRMKTLAALDVSCNEISHLPQQIGELPALRSLNLRRNKLVDLPLSLTNLNLERLNLSENRISTLPAELRFMTTLVELILTHNPLISPPAYLCTRGRVHVFKYLENQAYKGDKRKGLLTDDIRKLQQKVGYLSDSRLSNGFSDLRQRRYNVDSGYSTSDGGSDKRWSQEIIVEEECDKSKGLWSRADSLPIPVKRRDTNGSCSGTSTPSTISPGDNINLEEEFSKNVSVCDELERRKTDKVQSDKEEGKNLAKDDVKPMTGSGTNKTVTNGPAQSPSTDVIVNGSGAVEDKRPLDHIQTYREYKEALRQQRALDGLTVYRPRVPGEGGLQPLNNMNQEEDHTKNEGNLPNNKTESLKNQDSSVNKRPVQKVPPSRNGATVTFQDNRVGQGGTVLNGTWSDYGGKSVVQDTQDTYYIKPNSPIKTSTSITQVPSSASPGSPRLVTTSLGYVGNIVPVSTNHHNRSAPTGNGSGSPRSPKIGTSRTVPWNRDVAPEKLSFTMRREFDKAREEAELIDQLRSHIETRLKMSLPEDMASALSDGVVLCHLANHVRPRSVASIHVPSPAVPKLTMARCRRNVDNFLEACRRIGVDEPLICCASDVLEGRGLVQVAITVSELLRFHQPRSPAHTAP
ncbi:leucine-rich repeat and calponin homology domain-containing protein-like [Schistocerca cancellata]|uniref:leucine-rich repeat and calponin homology domain-containing protein-like n=1 Tax=Schistocerca cancellata TaxID=274614 RepID=UPI00211850B4|nr:leucine-rich repeat and calponin homology domain-containing protein-like [Schistocerca cancellata]